ncbi:MAG TPA: 16S rRNA (guanine(527)-N(7))-methyltransferase RsmG [Tissierellaceae bacterium]
MGNVDTLLKGLRDLDITLNQEQISKFIKYKSLLIEWNERINITAITDEDEIDIKHFLDSLTPVTTKLFEGNVKVIDIGTGGGFPGIPLKIYNEKLNVTLLDSLNKRIVFLNEVIKSLGFNDIEAVHGRAEELGRKVEFREQYDISISRAVATLNTLSEYCIPFVKVGGYFISMKGPDVEEELKDAKRGIEILGGKVVEVKSLRLPQSDIIHTLIIVEKIKETPTKYPRAGGKPKKNPL